MIGGIWPVGILHVSCLERCRLGRLLLFALVGVTGVQTLHDLIGVSSVSCFEQHVYVDSELDGVASWSRPEVVLSSLQSLAPSVEMHQRHLVKLRVFLVEVQTLRLADVRSSGNSKVHHFLLADLPHGLVDLFDVIRDFFDILNATIVGDNLVLDGGIPKIQLDQVPHEMLVDANKFTRKHPPRINIRGKRFETLIISENL